MIGAVLLSRGEQVGSSAQTRGWLEEGAQPARSVFRRVGRACHEERCQWFGGCVVREAALVLSQQRGEQSFMGSEVVLATPDS